MKYRQKSVEDAEKEKINEFLNKNMEFTKLEIVNDMKKFEPEIIKNGKILVEENSDYILINTLKWFADLFDEYNIVLNDEVLAKVMFLANSENKEISNEAMNLIISLLSFDSKMVNFLFENDVISLALKSFPSFKSFKILSNLALIHPKSKLEIMKYGIAEELKNIIDSKDNFSSESIQLIDALVYKIDEENYNAFFSEYICLFDIILHYEDIQDEDMLFMILRTIRDFIDAKQIFLMHFLENNQFPKILSINTNNELCIYQIIQIAKCICVYAPQGYQYIIDNDILNWLSNTLLYQDQTVLEKSFILLSNIIFEEEKYTANYCIENSFHLIAISRIKENVKLFLKKAIFHFLLDLCNFASPDYLIELYHDGVFYVLFEYISLSDEENRFKIYDAFKKYRENEKNENVEFLLNQMRENEDFMDWINEGLQSGNYVITNYTNQLFPEFS